MEYRKMNDLTQEDLAKKIGVTKQAISNYEKGRSSPYLSKLKPIADTLGVSASWLIGYCVPMNYKEDDTFKTIGSMPQFKNILEGIQGLDESSVKLIIDLAIKMKGESK